MPCNQLNDDPPVAGHYLARPVFNYLTSMAYSPFPVFSTVLHLHAIPTCVATRQRRSFQVSSPGFTARPDCATIIWLSLIMDIDEPRTPKLSDMRPRGPHKHWCKVCTKNFPSGRALGGHMSCHRHSGIQPKSTPIPPVIVVDMPVSLLGPSDEKPSLPSLETQCLHCSKEFSTCQSLTGNMRMHSETKVITKLDEEPSGMKEASANSNGDHGHNVMLFSPVKRKRSKRGMPALDSEEMCAAAALLMLAEYSDKTSAYEDCYEGDNDDSISTPNLLKEVNLNAFGQLVQSDEFTNNTRPKSDKNSAYEGFYELSEKENSLNLAADVPKKMVLLNVFNHGLVDGEAEFMKPGADISAEEVKSGNLSVAFNVKRYQCEVCGKLLRSGYALGCHMRSHCEKENSLNLVADVPKKELLLSAFDHGPDVDAEFMKPGTDNSVEDLKPGDLSAAANIKRHQCKVCGKLLRSGQALGGHMTLHLHRRQDNTLNLVADVPKKEVLLILSDHGLDVDAEFMKPGADISVEEMKSSDLSAAVNVKRHQCKVCGKLLRSGLALGGHMRLHYVRKCNLHQGAADCRPNSALMEEQMQKLGLDSPIFYRRRPRSHGSEI
ncbi:hypothetical protein BAE44_0001837 [Dichanthelium oligosanthes]|uniref:C2H2-type domain-containing protein n=1 Tax=Dichanthelium oligosanthes TaxID=888268 RepID=A0A1E5WIC5_9POAL|nr:hypothetical protein BAE44_0001837 [Dichanthelium oligosanthes]